MATGIFAQRNDELGEEKEPLAKARRRKGRRRRGKKRG